MTTKNQTEEERKNDFRSNENSGNSGSGISDNRRNNQIDYQAPIRDLGEGILYLGGCLFLDLRLGETFSNRRMGEERRKKGISGIRPEEERRHRGERRRYLPSREEVTESLKKYGYFTY